jgi:hypothetical protein
MGPSSGIKASEILSSILSMGGNPTKSDIVSHLTSNGLLNDGVKSFIKGTPDRDILSSLGEMGDDPISKTFKHSSDFFSPSNSEFFTEKALPGLIGGIGAAEMLAHSDERFGDPTYKKLYQELERKPYTKPEGMSHFQNDTIQESENPYGRTKWSKTKRNKIASVDEDLAKLLPSNLTSKNVMAKFQNQAFLALADNQKVAYIERTLQDLSKDLKPLMEYLNKIGFNVYNGS